MAVIRGQSYRVGFVAWDLANNAPKTGDAANITVRIRKDGGTLTAATNNPVEVDATNAPGLYEIELTASEMDANTIEVVPKSTTTGVQCTYCTILTERGRIDASISSVAGSVWSHTTRTLTGFGTLVNDVASAVWGYSTRTLTGFGTLVNDVASAVWGYSTRTLTSFGTLVADIWSHSSRTLTSFGTLVNDTATAVWSYTTRTLTSFGTLVSDVASAVWSHSTRTLTSLGTLANESANAVWSYTVEASQSAVAWMRLMGAALFGKRTVSGSTYTHRDWNDTKDRIVGSVDSSGNRTITTRDGS